MKVSERGVALFFLAVDWLFLGLGLSFAYFLRQRVLTGWYDVIQPPKMYGYLFIGSLFLFSFLGWLKGIYNWQLIFKRKREKYFWRVWENIFLFGILLMGGSYLVKYDFSRVVVLGWWLFLLILLPLIHLFIGNKIASVLQPSFLIIGRNQVSDRLRRSLVADFIFQPRIKVKAKLPSSLRESYDEIIITDSDLSPDKIFSWLERYQKEIKKVSLTLNFFPRIFTDPSLHLYYDSLPRLSFTPPSTVYYWLKRVGDIILSSFLLVLTFPLWLIIGFFIFTQSGRWPIIGLWRVGYQGKVFKMYKFLTMKGEPKEAKSPHSAEDPRIYFWGRWLRRSSLDELPQLVNILKGEMSLVGPRPEMKIEVDNYRRWQKIRLQVKPGLTGLWQILGRKDLPLKKNIEYDLYYVANRSLWFDLWILLLTPWIVLTGRGAY